MYIYIYIILYSYLFSGEENNIYKGWEIKCVYIKYIY